MKKIATLSMALMLMAAFAGSAAASSIAGKVWNAESEELDDTTLMYGGTASLSLGETLWISGMYLTGAYEDMLGSGIDIDTADAEVILGLSFQILDVGIGARYSEWTFTADGEDVDMAIFGPMAYLGLGDSFGESPLGWYLGGSYMFKDFGDAYDEDWEDTYEHYNVEGGLSLFLDPVMATVGYRYKDYVNFEESSFSGVAASVGFGF